MEMTVSSLHPNKTPPTEENTKLGPKQVHVEEEQGQVTAQRTRTILRVIGYFAFFVACFFIFLVITFPYDRLTGYAEGQIEKALGVEANIDRLRPTIFGGVRLEGVTLGPALPTKGAPPPTSTSPYVRLDEAVVSVSLLGLLLGGVDTDFDAELAGGQAEGSFEQDETHVALQLKLLGVQAKSLPILREKVGLPVGGTLSADIEFDVPVGKAVESTGSFTLTLQSGVIGDGEAKLSLGSLMGYGKRASTSSDEGTLIQPIKLGPIALESKMVKGELAFPRVEAISEHAELSFEGRIKLAEPLSQSRIDTYLTVKLTDAYAQQDETTETLVSLANTVGHRPSAPTAPLASGSAAPSSEDSPSDLRRISLSQGPIEASGTALVAIRRDRRIDGHHRDDLPDLDE